MGLVAWGELTVPSGIAGVMVAMMPVWVAVLGRIFLGERLPSLAVAGIVAGVAGVVALVGTGVAIDRSLDAAGILALIASPIFWAVGSLFAAHRARLPKDPFVTTGLQMLFGAGVLAVVAVASGEVAAFRSDKVTPDSIVAIAYLTGVGSLVAFTAFAWVLRHAPLPLITTYAFVNPVIAVFLGALLLGETIRPTQLAAGAVIVAGVALIIVARSRLAAAPPTADDLVDPGERPAAA
jgi:drug/metabolite transporter (DMT)-like permease